MKARRPIIRTTRLHTSHDVALDQCTYQNWEALVNVRYDTT